MSPWISESFGCECKPFRELGFQSAADRDVFLAARQAGAIILTKDSKFVELQRLLGAPPKIIWLRCGNRSNQAMKELLTSTLPEAFNLLVNDDFVEIA